MNNNNRRHGHRVPEDLTSALEAQNELLRQFAVMLARSEERIDRTNAMIADLAHILEGITEKYVHHIDSLTACRDVLLDEIKSLTGQLSHECGREDMLTDRLVRSALSGRQAANNISVSG